MPHWLIVVAEAHRSRFGAFGKVARIGLDGYGLSVRLAVDGEAHGVIAGLQSGSAAASAWAWASLFARGRRAGGMTCVNRGRGLSASTESSAAEAWSGDVESDTMHARFGRGRRRGLLPISLHVNCFGIDGFEGRVAGQAGRDLAVRADKLNLYGRSGRRFEPIVSNNSRGWVILLRLFVW